MPLTLLLLIIVSVLMSSSAQLLLKSGMTSGPVANAISAGGHPTGIVLAVFASPLVWGGLVIFGLSVVVWLAVLAQVPVSQAYPAVALGIVITTLGGHFFFGEPMNMLRVLGIAAIIAGVLMVARS